MARGQTEEERSMMKDKTRAKTASQYSTAADFARAAAQMGRAAQEMKPDDSDPNAQARKLIQYHLLSAASKTREIADSLAKKKGLS
jgi:hypothetical protein